MVLKNLTLIGTSHISKQSLKDIEEAIEEKKPEVIAIELDRKRVHALSKKQKGSMRLRDIRRVGVKGWLFAVIGSYVERKLGKLVGMEPGAELMHAVKLAKKHGIALALIDQDIDITLKKFGKALTWKEKGRFVWDILKAVITRKPEIEFDLNTVPSEEIIEQMVGKVKDRYPSLYQVLIVERNHIMARRIAALMSKYPEKHIVAVVGAGHKKDMLNIIEHLLKNAEFVH